MKSTIVILSHLSFLLPVQADVNVSETSSQGKWELIKMSGRT
jgi:hypothetical protein